VSVDFGDRVQLVGYDVVTDRFGRGSLHTYWRPLQPLDRNYFLFPFFADESGAPAANLNFYSTVLFWYPAGAWKPGEIVVARTLPLDWGERIHAGVGVVDGDNWADAAARLPVTRVEPSNVRVGEDGTWVELGVLTRSGARYAIEPP
jgi:hypothetical protein